MEDLAERCAAAAVAALAVGGVVAALTPVAPSLPNVQVRDFGLVAALNVDTNAAIETVENHVRPDMVGSSGDFEQQQINLGELLLGRLDGDLGDGSTTTVGDLDQSALNSLLGGGFDAHSMLSIVPPDVDLGGVASPAVSSFSATDQVLSSAVANAAMAFAQSLPMAYQSFTNDIANAELAFNSALVDAQEQVVGHFGGGTTAGDVASLVFSANNSVVAQNEEALNSLLGISLNSDTLQSSLLSEFTPGSAAASADWNSLLASLSPGEVTAVLHDNLALLLSDLDLPSYMTSFILGLF